MSEKSNLKSIDQEATLLRASYTRLQEGVVGHERVTQAYGEGKMHGGKPGPEMHLRMAGGVALMASDREQQSKAHYEQNTADYHDLAVAEAASNGVQIEVQQPHLPEQSVDVIVK